MGFLDTLSSNESKEQMGDKKAEARKKQCVLISLTTLTVVAAIAVAVVISLYCYKHRRHSYGPYVPSEAAELYSNAAVAADAVTCSEIGAEFLKKNGSAVDAAIASCFCLGVINMHSSGLGGGGFMLVYNRQNKSIEAFDYREKAPMKATENMYEKDYNKSRIGGLAIAIPGEVKGMYAAWKKYGRLPWRDLIQPAIDMTTTGFKILQRLHEAIHQYRHVIEQDPGLRMSVSTDLIPVELPRQRMSLACEALLRISHAMIRGLLFKDGHPLELGMTLKIPELSETLKKIQENPEDFYTGKLAQQVVKDIQAGGGLATADDLADYKVENRKVLINQFKDLTMYTVPAPTGGPIVFHILNILRAFKFSPEDLEGTTEETVTVYHRIAEAFKFAYGQRTKEGDPEFLDKTKIQKLLADLTSAKFGEETRRKIWDNTTFNLSYYGPEFAQTYDKGTTHVSIYAPNGDAVSVTHTVNEWFGAAYRSPTTGIIYNNEMDDFSNPGAANLYGFPPTPANYIRPGKRPLSSSAPIIIVDNQGDVKMVLGSSGGTRIITATAQVLIYKLLFNNELGKAVSRPRFHHQLVPNWVVMETTRELPIEVQRGLEKKGHQLWFTSRPEFSACQAIYVEKQGRVHAKSDPRKYGHTAGF